MELKKGYKQTDIGIIPIDWDKDTVNNIASIKTGSRNTQDRVENGEYPFFVRSQIVERINSFSFDGEAVLTAGDGVGVGKVMHYIKGKFDCHQRVYRISNFSEILNGRFFYLYFSSNFYNRIMQMTAKSSVDSVRMEMIADMQIPIPPTISEQTAIATALSDADDLISGLEKLIEKKRNIKHGVMQELLRPKEGWEVKKLGEIAVIKMGQSPLSIYYNKGGDGLPLIQGNADVENRKTIVRSYTSITTKKGEPDEIIMSVRAPVGEIAKATFECCLGRGVCAIKYKNEYKLAKLNANLRDYQAAEKWYKTLYDLDTAKYIRAKYFQALMQKYNGNPIGLQLPMFVELVVTATEPGMRGDSSSGSSTKPATLETGLEIKVPLFIKVGEKVKIATEGREFSGRV